MSKQQSFTPGPWKVDLRQEFPWGVRVLAGDREVMCQGACCHSSRQKTRKDCEDGYGFGDHGGTTIAEAAAAIAEQDANARLISAAPELLTELSHLVQLLEPLEREGQLHVPGLATLNGARAAIQKSRGTP